jgi:hypothetical protein
VVASVSPPNFHSNVPPNPHKKKKNISKSIISLIVTNISTGTFAASCHGGHGACVHTGAVAVNATNSWAIHNDRLYWFNHDTKQFALKNTTIFDLAERNWALWYQNATTFNTDAFWPYETPDGESLCRTCGFEEGSSLANKVARNRYFLARSGAVTALNPHNGKKYPQDRRQRIPGVR